VKRRLGLLVVAFAFCANAVANQVFYRFGKTSLSKSRGEQVFTDVNGANGKNDDDSGTSIGAGIDLKLFNCPLKDSNILLGEVFASYTKYSEKKVVNAIEHVAGLDSTPKTVTVSSLEVTIAPKYMFGLGKFKPWIIPVGLSFLVNSPPSNTTTYLDYGLHFGAGAQYDIVKQLSVGLDARYTSGSGDPQLKTKYTSFGAYLGINF
jgi:opacity protein-like surface antigen